MESHLDFYEIAQNFPKANAIVVYPEYLVQEEMHDLMVRGGAFYAVWDPDKNIWNRNERSVKRLVDRDVEAVFKEVEKENQKKAVSKKLLKNNSSGKWAEFKTYMKNLSDSYNRLDENVCFQKLDENAKITLVNYRGVRMKKENYVSKSLPYSLEPGEPEAWNEMISVLYDPDERDKIEWAIGAILTGDAKKIQKFLVFYGPQGSGKSTVLNIVMKLLAGYYTTFKAENLVKGNDSFNLDFLAEDPLVAIDADTNLSHIESNALINQIVSHEQLKVNEKFKNRYPNKPMCMLMLGTNQPVKITDAKSGIIRRLIDIEPSGRLIKPEERYDALNEKIDGELGKIAQHCINIYKELGRTYYSDYIPERMMYRTDAFFNFMEEKMYLLMKKQRDEIESGDPYAVEGISAANLWTMWKQFCEESGIEYSRKRFEIIDEAKNYFEEFHKEPVKIGINKDGSDNRARSWFTKFKFDKFNQGDEDKKETRRERKMKEKKDIQVEEPKEESWLKLDKTKSLLDDILKECKAQYEMPTKDHPLKYTWANCKTKLKDIDTSKTHYVQGFSQQLVTVDFDKKGPDGKKDLEANLKAASEWPPTYAELSNSGVALHLEYFYDGDPNDVSSVFDEDVEIKVFPDDKSLALRRRVSACNDLPIAHLKPGSLPFKEKRQVINWDGVQDDKHLRNLINQAIAKNIRPYGEEPKTITCVKYIRNLLKQAQDDGMTYDIRDLENLIYSFAASSHHNSEECIRIFYDMELKWPKEDEGFSMDKAKSGIYSGDAPIIILDCEVTRNLILVVYKELEPDGIPAVKKNPKDIKNKCVRLYNPKPHEIEKLFRMKIVGHNVVGYDNHILYALYLGYSPEEVFNLSQSIIVHGKRSPFYEAKNVSYTDTLDVASSKKGLKKIEIEMHIPHKEMEVDWSKPLPESEWERLATYCENDVFATEAYFLSDGWQADFKAREILADLTGMTVNDSTNNLTAQLIFGDVKEPWHEFNYPDLKAMFPEYVFDPIHRKSYYGDVEVGEGGRVYAEEGTYYNVVTFDVASMHPTSIIVENGFGPYTKNYEDLYKARIAIKHKDYEAARKMFCGKLAKYLENSKDAKALSYALKIALNSVYGMTAATFQNRFKDPRNNDNWVAKRGALFMEKLRREVQARGGHVIHIKTDSIKLVNPTPELSDFVINFGKQYGYTFEIESRYERICLVNHAVYIALRAKNDAEWLEECEKAKKHAEETETPYFEPTRWTATGAQFQHPYVFKRLFSHEPMNFWDFCETKNVKTSLYLDLNEKLPDISQYEKEKTKIKTRIRKLQKDLMTADLISREKISAELEDLPKDIAVLDEEIAKGHAYTFVGKTGEFMPVIPGAGGGLLMRKEADETFGYAVGAKGYRWLESETMEKLDDWKKYVDIRYFRSLVDDAKDTINKFCDFDLFVKGEDGILAPEDMIVEYDTDPWMLPCKSDKYAYCSDCPDFRNNNTFGYFCGKGYTITNQLLGESKESISL